MLWAQGGVVFGDSGQELRGVGIPVDEDCQSWVREALGPCCYRHHPFPKSQWSEDSPSAPTPCSAHAVVGSAMSHPYRLPHHLSSSPLLSTLRGTAGALAGGGLPSCMLLGHSVPIVLSRGRCPGPGERRGGGSGQGLCSPHTTQQPSLGLGLFSHNIQCDNGQVTSPLPNGASHTYYTEDHANHHSSIHTHHP